MPMISHVCSASLRFEGANLVNVGIDQTRVLLAGWFHVFMIDQVTVMALAVGQQEGDNLVAALRMQHNGSRSLTADVGRGCVDGKNPEVAYRISHNLDSACDWE